MLAMREMDLVDYLATEHGRREARLQMITFGPDYREAVDALSDEALLSLALAFARREHVVLAPSARSGAFNEMLAKRLSFRPKPLARLNTNEPAMRAAHFSEFQQSDRDHQRNQRARASIVRLCVPIL